MSEAMEEREVDLSATDPHEYTKMRRLRHVLDMREWFLDKSAEVDEYLAEGLLSTEGANTIIRRTLEQYIMTVESIAGEDDPWTRYWEEAKLGKQVIAAPPDAHETDVEVAYVGLQSLFGMPDPITLTWTREQSPPASTMGAHPNGATVQEEETVQIPRRVLKDGYRYVNSYLNEIGMDIEVKDTNDTWGFVEVDDE